MNESVIIEIIFNGKINRIKFISGLLIYIISYSFLLMFGYGHWNYYEISSVYEYLLVLFLIWIMSRRFRDLNFSGASAAIPFILIIALEKLSISSYFINIMNISIFIIILLLLCSLPEN